MLPGNSFAAPGSYGYNAVGTARFPGLGLGDLKQLVEDDPNDPVKESDLRSPANMVAVADTVQWFELDPLFKRSGFKPFSRHLTGNNFSFCDGHVQPQTLQQAYGTNGVA